MVITPARPGVQPTYLTGPVFLAGYFGATGEEDQIEPNPPFHLSASYEGTIHLLASYGSFILPAEYDGSIET